MSFPRSFFALLLLASSGAEGFAVFRVNTAGDYDQGNEKICSLRAAFDNINNQDLSGLNLPPNLTPEQIAKLDCPRGEAVNFIEFTFPPGAQGYREIKLNPGLGPIGHYDNKAVIVGLKLNGSLQTGLFRVSQDAELELEHSWLEEAAGPAILVDSDEPANLRLHDVRIVRNLHLGFGAGIAFNSPGDLYVSRAYIGSNESGQGFGGGMWVAQARLAFIVDSTFETNRAAQGGGAIYCSNAATEIFIENTSLRSNAVTQGSGIGGGAILNDCRMSLRIAEINDNSTVLGDGGGIYNLGGGQLSLKESRLYRNKAGVTSTAEGGGIQNDGALTMNGVSVQANRALLGGGVSISAAAQGRAVSIVNSTFVENEAVDNVTHTAGRGSALWIADVAFKINDEHRLQVFNNTFYDNFGDGQIHLSNDGKTDTQSLLFANNLVQQSVGVTSPPCSGRIERLKLEVTPGQGVLNTQWPGKSCDTPTSTMPSLDLQLGNPMFGGNFQSAWLLPPGGAGGLPTGDYKICSGMAVNDRDQFLTPRLCRQGAVEAPPAFTHTSAGLPN